MYDLGLRIKLARKRKGISQRTLAKKVNRSVSAISGYERNDQTPPTEILISIAETLNEPITYFVDYEAEPTLSLKSLTTEQRELIELLHAEFSEVRTHEMTLTPRRIEIIRRLMVQFSL